MVNPEDEKWKEVRNREIQSIYDNKVWNLFDPTPSLKTISCRWVFKKKTNMDRNVQNYKAQLVAKGYTHT